jgi:hypothetical protein
MGSAWTARFGYNSTVVLRIACIAILPCLIVACRWVAPYGLPPGQDANFELAIPDADFPPPPPDAGPDSSAGRAVCPTDPNHVWKAENTPRCNADDTYCLIHPILQGRSLMAMGGTCYKQHYTVGNEQSIIITDGKEFYPLPRDFKEDGIDYQAIWGYDGANTFVVGNMGTVLKLAGTHKQFLTEPNKFTYKSEGKEEKDQSLDLTGVWGNDDRLFITGTSTVNEDEALLCITAMLPLLEDKPAEGYECSRLKAPARAISGHANRLAIVGDGFITVVKDAKGELNDSTLAIRVDVPYLGYNSVVFADERWAFAIGTGTDLIRIDTDADAGYEIVKLFSDPTSTDTSELDAFTANSIDWRSIEKNDAYLFLAGVATKDKNGYSLMIQIPLDEALSANEVSPKVIWNDADGSPVLDLHFQKVTSSTDGDPNAPHDLLYAVGAGGLILRNDSKGPGVDIAKWTRQGGLSSRHAHSTVVDLWHDTQKLTAITQSGTLFSVKDLGNTNPYLQHIGSAPVDDVYCLVGVEPPPPQQFNYVFGTNAGLLYCKEEAGDCNEPTTYYEKVTVFDLYSDGGPPVLATGAEGYYKKVDSVPPEANESKQFVQISAKHEYKGVWPYEKERFFLVGKKTLATVSTAMNQGLVTLMEANGAHVSQMTLATSDEQPLEALVSIWGSDDHPPKIYALGESFSLYEITVDTVTDPSSPAIHIELRVSSPSPDPRDGASLVGRKLGANANGLDEGAIELWAVDGENDIIYSFNTTDQTGAWQQQTLADKDSPVQIKAVAVVGDFTYVAGTNGRIYRKRTLP